LAKVTVLIADDLKFFLEVESTYLKRGGFQVLTAASGAEAVAVASKEHPQLVLLDLEMPEMDGAAACAAMRKIPALALTPIIIMSAGGTPETRDRCRRAGCTEFVPKPEKPEDLLGVVARILKIKSRSAERITVVFEVVGATGTHQVVGRATNLSAAGLMIESAAPLPVGAILTIEFFLHRSHHQVRTEVEVIRAEHGSDGAYRAGVRFTALSQADQEQILEYVSS